MRSIINFAFGFTLLLAGLGMINFYPEDIKNQIGHALVYLGMFWILLIIGINYLAPFIHVKLLKNEEMTILVTAGIYLDSLKKGNVDKYQNLDMETLSHDLGLSKTRAKYIIKTLKGKRLVILDEFNSIVGISDVTRRFLLKKNVL